MSRTIRRKNGKNTHSWHCEPEAEFNRMAAAVVDYNENPDSRFKWVGGWYQKWTFGKTNYKDYVAACTAHYHADKRAGYYTPPSCWIQWNCTRPLRRRTKDQMHHALVNDTWDNTVIEPYMKNAMWYYW